MLLAGIEPDQCSLYITHIWFNFYFYFC